MAKKNLMYKTLHRKQIEEHEPQKIPGLLWKGKPSLLH
jgi:hypothetical protein